MTSTKKQRRDDARNLALDTLLAIEREKQPSHLVMQRVIHAHPEMDLREAHFYRKLVSGVLEWRLKLDYIIDQFSRTSTRKMKPVIREILRLAVYQINDLDAVPDAAAVNEAVRMTVQRGFGNLRGFVNGVLRAIVRGKDRIHWPDRETEPENYLRIMYGMPANLSDRWYRTYGFRKTELICASFQKQAPLTVRFRDEMDQSISHVAEARRRSQLPGDADAITSHPVDVRSARQTPKGASVVNSHAVEVRSARQTLEDAGITVSQAPYIPYAGYLSDVADLEALPAFSEGLITVQDVSSMLAVEAAGIQPGNLVLDLAAAPGGKSMLAADKLNGSGKVIARDISERKTQLIQENLDRMQISNIETQVWDGTVFDPSMEEKADVVIADLPCSGLGVIGRKPDIRYAASDEKTESLVRLQRQILQNAVRYVRPGGTLLFSTCTFDPRENEANVKWILEHSDLKPDPVAPYLPQDLAEEAGSSNCLQLFPGIHACDGFFFARFRR